MGKTSHTILFIGGAYDGMMIGLNSLPTNLALQDVAVTKSEQRLSSVGITVGTLQTIEYKRLTIEVEDEEERIYVYVIASNGGIAPKEVLRRLVESYAALKAASKAPQNNLAAGFGEELS